MATPLDVVKKLMAVNFQHRFEFPIKEFAFLLFSTGVRQGEALHMEVPDIEIDPDQMTGMWRIRVKPGLSHHSGPWLEAKNGEGEGYSTLSCHCPYAYPSSREGHEA